MFACKIGKVYDADSIKYEPCILRIPLSLRQSNQRNSSPPQALLADVDIAGVLCTVGTNAG